MDQEAISMEASGPGGIKGKISFHENLSAQEWLLFLILILLGVLIFLVVQQEADRERRYTAASAAYTAGFAQLINQGNNNKAEHGVMVEVQRQQAAEQRIQTYVLTLDEKQRKGLNLQEPDELRNRIRR